MHKPSDNNSRFLLALGAFIGFSLAFFAALGAGSDVNTAVMRGAAGMLAGLLMMKFFLRVLYDSARSVREQKRIAQEKAEAERRRRAEEAELEGFEEDPSETSQEVASGAKS